LLEALYARRKGKLARKSKHDTTKLCSASQKNQVLLTLSDKGVKQPGRMSSTTDRKRKKKKAKASGKKKEVGKSLKV